MKVTFPGGLSYTPGVKQHLVVTISDPAQKSVGFPVDGAAVRQHQDDGRRFQLDGPESPLSSAAPTATDPAEVFLDFGQNQNCAASKPLAYIEHTADWFFAAASRIADLRIRLDAARNSVGNINHLCRRQRGQRQRRPDRRPHLHGELHTNSRQRRARRPRSTPTACRTAPASSRESFRIPGSRSRAVISRRLQDTWDKAIVDGKLPTSLDGVSVTIGGKPAYIYFVSPGQINAIAPDVGSGTHVGHGHKRERYQRSRDGDGTTALSPAFFLWPGQTASLRACRWHVRASRTGPSPGLTTVAGEARRDVMILWGTGFGPTSPAAPLGMQTPGDKLYSTANPRRPSTGWHRRDGISVAALAPGFAGLYQVAIQIPANAAGWRSSARRQRRRRAIAHRRHDRRTALALVPWAVGAIRPRIRPHAAAADLSASRS